MKKLGKKLRKNFQNNSLISIKQYSVRFPSLVITKINKFRRVEVIFKRYRKFALFTYGVLKSKEKLINSLLYLMFYMLIIFW